MIALYEYVQTFTVCTNIPNITKKKKNIYKEAFQNGNSTTDTYRFNILQ